MAITRRDLAKFAGASAAAGILATGSRPALAQDDRPIMRVGNNASDIGNLDPHYSTTFQDWIVRDMIFNSLIRYVPGDSTQFEPDIAVEMPTAETNDDGTQTWTFKLREDVVVHPTESTESYILTADDVLFSYEKAGNPDASGWYQDYVNWTVEALDDFTVTITVPFVHTEALFFPRAANYFAGHIVPRKPYEAIGKEGFIRQPVGTGPFRFESHTPQNNVMMLAHDDYFRGAPLLGGVELRFIADTTSRELALMSDDVDIIAGIPDSTWVERIDQNPDYTVDVHGVGEVIIVNLDTQHEILQDRRVREAIYLAISREQHAALAGEPVAKMVYSVAPYDVVPGGLTAEEAAEAGVDYPQDLDRSRELLADAGYADGFTLDLVTSELPVYRQHYVILAEELRQVGIEVNLEVVQHAAMHELIREDRNAIVIYSSFRPNVDFYLAQFYSSDSGVTNFSNYAVDDLRDAARAETDPDKQVEIWKEAMIELAAECAATGLLYNNQVYARSNRVDYGHELTSAIQTYPVFTEKTTMTPV